MAKNIYCFVGLELKGGALTSRANAYITDYTEYWYSISPGSGSVPKASSSYTTTNIDSYFTAQLQAGLGFVFRSKMKH